MISPTPVSRTISFPERLRWSAPRITNRCPSCTRVPKAHGTVLGIMVIMVVISCYCAYFLSIIHTWGFKKLGFSKKVRRKWCNTQHFCTALSRWEIDLRKKCSNPRSLSWMGRTFKLSTIVHDHNAFTVASHGRDIANTHTARTREYFIVLYIYIKSQLDWLISWTFVTSDEVFSNSL